MMENKAFSKSQKKNAAGDFISVSPAVVRRLPRYHRYLKKLLHNGVLRISSAELSKIMNVTASQIRQDLNCFGGFGQQGYGYNVKYLDSKIIEILGLEQERNAILIGAGNLGRALVCSNVFQISGITLIATSSGRSAECRRYSIGARYPGDLESDGRRTPSARRRCGKRSSERFPDDFAVPNRNRKSTFECLRERRSSHGY